MSVANERMELTLPTADELKKKSKEASDKRNLLTGEELEKMKARVIDAIREGTDIGRRAVSLDFKDVVYPSNMDILTSWINDTPPYSAKYNYDSTTNSLVIGIRWEI